MNFNNFGEAEPVTHEHPVDIMEPVNTETSLQFCEVREAIYYILSEFKKSGNVRLTLDCLCATVGLSVYYDESYESIARKHGVTRQDVHKRVGQMLERMGLVGDAFSKNSKTGETYRLTNRRNTKHA